MIKQIFLIALFIELGRGNRTITLYTTPDNGEGNSMTLRTNQPDFQKFCPHMAKSSIRVCATGLWALYKGTNYTGSVEFIPKDDKTWTGEKCQNINLTQTIPIGSVRHIGPDASRLPDKFKKGHITMFSQPNFLGDLQEYPGRGSVSKFHFPVKSFVITSTLLALNWTMFTQHDYKGNRTCIFSKDVYRKFRNLQFPFLSMVVGPLCRIS